VSCTLDTTSTDGAGFQWGLDDSSLPNKKLDTSNGTGGDAQTISIDPANGRHTLYARTIDSGGNLSTATTAYSFGVGADGAAILSPSDGDTTARRLTLSAKGLTSYTGVTWQYRRGETDSWHTVPVGVAPAAAAKYGSLGAYQRATDGLARCALMGVRVYDPTTGRFLQTDPVYGGNTSAYICPADPIGQVDTSGELNYRNQTKKTRNYTLSISRNCTGESKCSPTWYVKLKSIWKKYGALKFVYSIALPGCWARKNQSYGHLEPGTYTFHGSWGGSDGQEPWPGKVSGPQDHDMVRLDGQR
jgi:RHS repeat-associated protein